MAEIFISIKADDPDELLEIFARFALKGKSPPSWLGEPLDAEAVQAEADARERIEAEDAAEDARAGNGADHEPPAPEPAKRVRAPRAPRVPAAPAPIPTAPPPTAAAAAAADLPPLDTLKAVVTNAVRLAQKGEGSKKILDLLPAFKDTTGLAFVMNADDTHRAALYDLVQAAGLPVV
jgi:hypothetical protein